MTPDLMEEGAKRMQAYAQRQSERTASGGRSASFGRLLKVGVPDFAHGVALYLEDITVSFDGFKALNALSLTVNVGELRCIIGPNGAGKTTMMDCITGKTRPDAGKVFFGSTIDLLRLTEPEIAQIGIGRKFQKPTVYEELSVFENLELALAADRRARASLLSRLTRRAARPHRRSAHADPPAQRGAAHRRAVEPRAEAVAGDRHAADAGPQAVAAR